MNAHLPAGAGPTYQVLTDLVHVRAATEAFTLFEVVAPPGGGPPPHRHAAAEVFHVVTGELTIAGDGDPIIAGPGDTVSVAAGAPHTYQNASDAPVRFLAVVTPGGMEAFFAELGTDATGLREPVPMDGPPDVERVLQVTAKHGIELLGGPPPG